MTQFGIRGPSGVAGPDPPACSQLSFTFLLLYILFQPQLTHLVCTLLQACTSCPFLPSLPLEIHQGPSCEDYLLGEDIYGSLHENSCLLP